MHIEFIDLLRCPKPHEESWLVAAFHRMDGRDVIEAKLGCPVCNAEYFIRDGVAIFGDGIRGARPPAMDPAHVAAYLNLTSPGKTVLLAGSFAACAAEIALMTEARTISLNAEHPGRIDQVAELRTGSRMPLAGNSLDAIALDEAHSSKDFRSEVERLLHPGGRLLVPASSSIPAGIRELTHDSNYIVAEKVTDLISLTRKS